MSDKTKISFWHFSLRGCGLNYSQINMLKSVFDLNGRRKTRVTKVRLFLGTTSSSGGKLALKNAHFYYKTQVWYVITETCGGVTGGFTLSKICMTVNQVVCFLLLSQALLNLISFFLIQFSRDIKR